MMIFFCKILFNQTSSVDEFNVKGTNLKNNICQKQKKKRKNGHIAKSAAAKVKQKLENGIFGYLEG